MFKIHAFTPLNIRAKQAYLVHEHRTFITWILLNTKTHRQTVESRERVQKKRMVYRETAARAAFSNSHPCRAMCCLPLIQQTLNVQRKTGFELYVLGFAFNSTCVSYELHWSPVCMRDLVSSLSLSLSLACHRLSTICIHSIQFVACVCTLIFFRSFVRFCIFLPRSVILDSMESILFSFQLSIDLTKTFAIDEKEPEAFSPTYCYFDGY